MEHEKKSYKVVYTIVEKKGQQKPFWTRIGVAFTNRDGSFNVHLDAVPINGQLHIRDPKELTDEEREQRYGRRRGNGFGAGNGNGLHNPPPFGGDDELPADLGN